jgi:hypothetical protein
MGRIHVESDKRIACSVDDVYGFLSDYTRRPAILTAGHSDWRVEQGGQGDGTVASYRLKVGPRERAYRIHVDVPAGEPRRIVERDQASSLVTTWVLEPLPNVSATQVRVVTEWDGASGVGGFFERTFAPPGLRRVQQEMLDKLTTTLGGIPTAAS